MRTRNLVILGALVLVAILAAGLYAPRGNATQSRYVPANVTVQPAAAAREATPVTYTLPTITPNQVPCGQPTTVDYPDSTDEITYDHVITTNGYIKIIAVLTDQGRTFTQPHEGWQVAPIAPYRAEHLTQITVTPCPEPAPEPPVTVTPAPEPVTPNPATEEEPPHGTNNCRE